MKKQNLIKRFGVKYILLILFVIGFYIFFQSNSHHFQSLAEISFWQFVVLFSLNFLFYALNGFIINHLLYAFKINLIFREQFYLSVMTTFGNYFLPFRGGAALRGLYLKNYFRLSYSRFIVAMMAQLLIVLLVALFAMFLLGIKLLFSTDHQQDYTFTILSSGLFLLSLLPIFFSKTIYRLVPFRAVRKQIFPFYRGWRLICRQPKNLFLLFIFTCFNLLTIALLLYFELIFLNIHSTTGEPAKLFDAIFISVFNLLSSILIITPGAIGIRESMMMAVSGFVSFAPAKILVASVLDRAINIVFILVACVISSILMRKTKRSVFLAKKKQGD